ncbi:Nop domain-containing protein [Aulographum hederae CBS 113979]|uniref:Nucleolar protein 56 n=1 Tax=Aulographum hederae CBS 113979 TaxID=1176131 RepID=A0A6G1GTH8_9PEZI|nr:Nop domain-containing protein [Aulographum hederae CBS 113979]
MSVDYLLHESGVGYAVFKVTIQADTVGNRLKEVQEGSQDLAKFGKMVQLVSFAPFEGASQALQNANDISEGMCSNYLKGVIEMNIPKAAKKSKVSLGVSDKNLASSIKGSFPYIDLETGETSEVVADLLRGLRLHSGKLLKDLQEGDVERAQLGLGHAYSRSKVKFSVQKNDNHIIQAIATLDQMDKAVNNFSMRVREWYSWHFPELYKIVSDNLTYSRLVIFIGDKTRLTDDMLPELAPIVDDDESVAQSIIDASRVSFGRDMSESDMEHVQSFARRAASLAETRKNMQIYLINKMSVVAPNLAALIGETVGARLIAKAGSLTNLCKYPASTLQILGAEKALFRALKTKGNTPKYGLIYHSSFIGKTATKNKGRISRFLSNKCSIASRIDNFSDTPTTKFGEALKKQVEERIAFYATGVAPMKNADAMTNAMNSVLQNIQVPDPTKGAESDEEEADGVTSAAVEQARRHKKEKKEKRKSDIMDVDVDDAASKKDKKSKKEKRMSEGGEVKAPKEKKSKRKMDDGEGEGEKKKKKKSKA